MSVGRIGPAKRVKSLKLIHESDFAVDSRPEVDPVTCVFGAQEKEFSQLEKSGIHVDRAVHIALDFLFELVLVLIGVELLLNKRVGRRNRVKDKEGLEKAFSHVGFVVAGMFESKAFAPASDCSIPGLKAGDRFFQPVLVFRHECAEMISEGWERWFPHRLGFSCLFVKKEVAS